MLLVVRPGAPRSVLVNHAASALQISAVQAKELVNSARAPRPPGGAVEQSGAPVAGAIS